MIMYDRNGNEMDIVVRKNLNNLFVPISNNIIDDKIKICKSIVITLLKTSNYYITFEITGSSQLLWLDNLDVYFNIDRNNGLLSCSNCENLGGNFVYENIIINY